MLLFSPGLCKIQFIKSLNLNGIGRLKCIIYIKLCFLAGRIARTYSEKCLDILTGLLALKQEHITSGKKERF